MELVLNPGSELEIKLTMADMHNVAGTFSAWLNEDPGAPNSILYPRQAGITIKLTFIE